MDHIFIDLGLTIPKPGGRITALAMVRTDGKGSVLASTCGAVDGPRDFGDAIDDAMSILLSSSFDKEYIIVAAHAETDRNFLRDAWKGIDLKKWQSRGHKKEPFEGRSWIDILQLAWPLVYNNQVSNRSFETLCEHFGVRNPIPGTAMGDCESLVRCYWKLMHQYRIALYGESVIRGIGGKGYETLVSFLK